MKVSILPMRSRTAKISSGLAFVLAVGMAPSGGDRTKSPVGRSTTATPSVPGQR